MVSFGSAICIARRSCLQGGAERSHELRTVELVLSVCIFSLLSVSGSMNVLLGQFDQTTMNLRGK